MEQDLAEKLGKIVLSAEEKGEITLNEDDVSASTEECLRSLFGRIYGSKKANFTGLHNFMEKTWQPKGNFEMKEVGYNCFQFIFSSKSDMERILERVHWSFENQYLLLKEWSEDTIDKIETMDKVGMWVQLWNIPFHWLSIPTGRKIARVFPSIHDVVVPETGRFIRIRVDVSLDKPLIRGTTISMGGKSRWVDFKYENLLGFCTYCGRVGHPLRNCEVRINDLAQNNLQQGQFGEWIRAPEKDPKTNWQHSRGRENESANWKTDKLINLAGGNKNDNEEENAITQQKLIETGNKGYYWGESAGMDMNQDNEIFRLGEDIDMGGVTDNSMVYEQESYEEVPETSGISKGEEAVAQVQYEVNMLAQQVSTMQYLVGRGIKVVDKELLVLAEMLMRQLLILDGIEAEEEGRARRRAEVRRVQSLVETVDELKSRNSNDFSIARGSFY